MREGDASGTDLAPQHALAGLVRAVLHVGKEFDLRMFAVGNLRAHPRFDEAYVARERQVDIVGDAAQQPRGIGHPVPPGAGDIGRAAEIGHGVSHPFDLDFEAVLPIGCHEPGDVVVPRLHEAVEVPQLMAVEADGTLAVHPFEAEPQGAAFADRGRWEEPRVAEIAVVAALVRAVGVVAEIGVCFHAGRNVRREDAAGTAGRASPSDGRTSQRICPLRLSSGMHSCALTPAASSERQSAKIRFIMACVFFGRGRVRTPLRRGNGVRADRYSSVPVPESSSES